MVHARGRRGSGRRRLRELTRSVLDTMEILEEVREKQAGVGGMSKALLQVKERIAMDSSSSASLRRTFGLLFQAAADTADPTNACLLPTHLAASLDSLVKLAAVLVKGT